jgi:hypothetical protein
MQSCSSTASLQAGRSTKDSKARQHRTQLVVRLVRLDRSRSTFAWSQAEGGEVFTHGGTIVGPLTLSWLLGLHARTKGWLTLAAV